jgi:hypothetical protein
MNLNELQFPLAELKKRFRRWLYLESDTMLDVIVGTYLANRFESDPLWMMLIGPPSNAKTEMLRAFEGHRDAKFISNLTPSTLVSGLVPKKNQTEPSLLPQLNGKLVILKDFTSILSMRSENQQEIIAQLREAYDGQYSKMFGNGKVIDWHGRFGLIAACTPVWDMHYGIIGAMGDRFLVSRTEHVDAGRMGLQAQRIVGQEDAMRSDLCAAMHQFVDQFKDMEGVSFSKDETVNLKIVNLACMVAVGRCAIHRDRYSQAVSYQPLPEGTPRLVKQFMQIGMGMALANGRTCVDEVIYQLIKKIGTDLLPVQRMMVLRELWEQGAVCYDSKWLETAEVADAINIPGSTAKMVLEDLMVVGALNRRRGDSEGGRPPYSWQVAEDFAEWVIAAEIFG